MADEITEVTPAEGAATDGGTVLTNAQVATEPNSDEPNAGEQGTAAAESDDKTVVAGEGEQVPETYEDFTLPEGIVMDEAKLGLANEVFKELNLTQVQAQKLIDLQTGMTSDLVEQQAEAFSQLKNTWLNDAQKDKEIGGDKFDENVAVAQKAMAVYGTEEFKKLMEDYGVGNNPEMLRFLYRVGQPLMDDNPGNGGVVHQEKSRKDIMYST
jgi:hypothetical protein